MAASAPATSSLRLDSVLLELGERHDVQRDGMRRLEHDLRRRPAIERLLPAAGAQAPAIARFQAGEAVLRQGRAEVVAVRLGEGEKLRCHDDADGMQADILAAGVAATVAVEAGHRLLRAGLEWAAQGVDRGDASRPA